jgi:hypothetical protein
MRPLALFVYATNIPDEASANRLERAVKKQTLSKKAGRNLSPIQKKCACLAKVLSKKEWLDMNLEVHLFGKMPESVCWPEGVRVNLH